MLLFGGGWGAPGKGCAAIAERAAVPGPIEHAGEPTAIAAIMLARLPLQRMEFALLLDAPDTEIEKIPELELGQSLDW